MALTSLSFIFVYFPLSLAAYYISPPRLRASVLLLISLGYGFLSWGLMWIAAASVAADYVIVSAMSRTSILWLRKSLISVSALKAAAAAVYLAAAPPLYWMGLLICTLLGLEYALHAYKSEEIDRNPLRLAVCCLFFPRLYAGPLSNPKSFMEQLANTKLSGSFLIEGLSLFSTGSLKMLIPGMHMMEIHATLIGASWEENSILTGWMIALTFALGTYYQLSGLGDMAKGIAALFGISIPKNFYYPYQSQSIGDFEMRFNSTLRAYFSRIGYPIAGAIAMGVWIGIWHGKQFEFLLFGLYLGGLILIERGAAGQALERLPMLFRRIISLFLIMLGFAFFSAPTMADGLQYLGMMFGFGGAAIAEGRLLYLLSSRWLILLLSCFFATNICSLLMEKMKTFAPRAYSLINAMLAFSIIAWITALQF